MSCSDPAVMHCAFSNPASLGARGFGNYNLDEVRQAVLPWTNINALFGTGNRANARHPWPPTVKLGVPRLQPRGGSAAQSLPDLDRARPHHAQATGFSQGFLRAEPGVFTPSEDFLGHPGTGGCLGFADPKTGVSFGYVMNRMRSHVRSPTAMALSQAVYASMERG